MIHPIGLKPRATHEIHHMYEIHAAITRYVNAGHPIPPEWVTEYNELATRNKE